jgi:hypothetical protein
MIASIVMALLTCVRSLCRSRARLDAFTRPWSEGPRPLSVADGVAGASGASRTRCKLRIHDGAVMLGSESVESHRGSGIRGLVRLVSHDGVSNRTEVKRLKTRSQPHPRRVDQVDPSPQITYLS